MTAGRYQRIALTLIMLLAWPTLASAEDKIVEDSEVAGWSLMATANSSNGETSCMVSRDDGPGPILGVTVQSGVDGVFLVLANLTPGEMEEGAFYDVRYIIDDGAPVPTAARATSQTQFLILIGRTFAALDAFRRAHKVAFKAPETIARFDLSGSTEAFEALQDCAERYIGRQFSEASDASRHITPDPAQTLPPPVSLPEGLAEWIKTAPLSLIEAMLVSELLLKEAHLLGNAEMMDGSSFTKAQAAGWVLPNAKLLLSVVAEGPEVFTEASLKSMSEKAQLACPSRVRIEQLSESAPGQVRFRAYCKGYPPNLLTLFSRRGSGGYLMSVAGYASPEGIAAAEQYDSRLAKTLVGWPNR